MIKFAGAEGSGVADPITGKQIYITTTARKAFRAANPAWARVRNALLNAAIANDFARAKPQPKPLKSRKQGVVGQVRDSSNGQYIAAVSGVDVRVVSVGKGGTPTLRTPAPVQTQVSPAPVAISFPVTDKSIVKHAVDAFAEECEMHSKDLDCILSLLSERTGVGVDELTKRIINHTDRESVMSALKSVLPESDYIWTTEDKDSFITDPIYDTSSDMPSSAFALQVGLAQR